MGLTFIFVGLFAPEYITLSRIFTTVNLLLAMRFVFVMVPTLFQQISQILASVRLLSSPSLPSASHCCRRIQDFISISEFEQIPFVPSSINNPPSVVLKEASYKWNEKEPNLALENISVNVNASAPS